MGVSVVIPCYRAADTIAAALDSIVVQGDDVEEVLVVDDGSGDATVAAVNAHRARHRIRLMELRENRGPAGARNAGIAAARGEWVAFLDGDDAWLPGKLTLQLALAEQNPDVDLWYGETIPLRDGDPPAATPEAAPFIPLGLDELAFGNPIPTSTVLVRRSVLDSVGAFDESFRGPEDYDLWLRIAVSRKLGCIAAPLSRYRWVGGSLSNDERRFLPEVLRVLDKAFGAGGALSGVPELAGRARGAQYFSASWMAFGRGDRLRAIQLLCRSWACSPGRLPKEAADPLLRVRLLCRYLLGRPPGRGIR